MRQFNQRVPTSATAGTILRAVIVTSLSVTSTTSSLTSVISTVIT